MADQKEVKDQQVEEKQVVNPEISDKDLEKASGGLRI